MTLTAFVKAALWDMLWKPQNFKVMKLTTVFLLAACLQLSANGSAQNVSLRVNNAPLERVLQDITRQTGYEFLYRTRQMKQAQLVTVQLANTELRAALDIIFKNQPLSYAVQNKTIVLSQKTAIEAQAVPAGLPPVVNMPEEEYANIDVKGRVVNETGKPVAGASVQVKGDRTKGTTTNENGAFELKGIDENATLVITGVSIETIEIKVNGRRDITAISVKTKITESDEVVINTGYQQQRLDKVTGAATKVNMPDVELASKFSIDQMLAGQVPGLTSLLSSGEPGATPKIRIRGTSSIIGGSAPLWVLDDIILEDPVNIDLSNLNGPDAQYLIGNAIAGINAKDVESITVLRDASATSIYGSRAANGVIVVTTKRGRVGKPQLNYTGSVGVNMRVGYGDLNLMNAGERVQLSQEIMEDQIRYSRTPRRLGYEGLYLDYLDRIISYDQFKTGVNKMVANNTDWYDLLFRNSISNNHSLNLSGGSGRTTYYASVGYSNIQGAAKGSDQKRYSAMLKLNSWKTDNFYVGLQLNASTSAGTGFHSTVNPNRYAYETARTIPAYNDDGSYFAYLTQQKSQEFPAVSAPKEDMLYNIINETNLTGAKSSASNVTAQLNLEYRFNNGFRYRFLGGYDMGLTNSSSWAGERSNYIATLRKWNAGALQPGTQVFEESVIPWGGIISNNDQRKNSYTLRNSIEYNKLISKTHLVNVMAVQELRSLQYKGLSGTYYGWQPERGNTISPALTAAYTGMLNSLRPVITDNRNNNLSWIGAASYSYKDKITFSGNIRADGSNNFGDNPKYRFLPIWSVAGKYTFSNEAFLKNSKVISYLAVRASYGLQGNIDKATSPDLIIQVGARDGVTGLTESYFRYLANPDLRWEKTRQYNLGLDFALFGATGTRNMDIISGTLDYYDKDGTDIIVSRRVSQVLGLDQVKVNGGRVRNSGVEGSLRITPYQTKNFSASIKFIASYNKNVLVEANKELNITVDNKIAGNALVEGQPIGAFYSYAYAGLNASSGFPMFYNAKGEKRYELFTDEIELVYTGVPMPKISGGFDVAMRYKGLYVSAGFQYAQGGMGRLPNFYRANYFAVFDPVANASKELLARWRKPGDEQYTNIPVLYDATRFSEAKAALNVPTQLGVSKNPLQMYDQSSIRTAKTDNIRLRNININYLFPATFLKRVGLETFSVNLQAENIFLITDKAWQGRDPESGSSNTPLPKVYTIGVTLGF